MADAGRRLPVYLVLDTSGSMSGEPIEAVGGLVAGGGLTGVVVGDHDPAEVGAGIGHERDELRPLIVVQRRRCQRLR